MEEKSQKEKEVSAQYIPVCAHDRGCCEQDEECMSTRGYVPQTNESFFISCGCNI